MDKAELLIIGAGAAGMTAAVSAWNSGCRSILLVDRNELPGGILRQCLHSGFGQSIFGEELTGPELNERLTAGLEGTGAVLKTGTTVTEIFENRTAVLSGKDGVKLIGFDRAILATGCREIPFSVLGISGTRPFGIYTAGEAQRMINLHREDIGKKIIILGSGDLGLIMARRLTLEGKHVRLIVEKLPHYSAMARNYRRCIEPFGIPIAYSSEITEVFGSPRICAAAVRNNMTGTTETLSCDTLVTAVGLLPDTRLTDGLASPPWLSLCGNCSRVHSIVDSALEEAERTGKSFGGRHHD